AEAGLSAGGSGACALRGPGLRSLLPAADGRPAPDRQYAACSGLLPPPTPLAALAPDPQADRHSMKRRARRRAAGPLPAMEVGYAFGFDAAHRFKGVPRGHKYGGGRGHPCEAEVVPRGAPRPPHGFVADFARLEKASLALRGKLDHTLLNEVEGLGTPSLENLCIWLWERLVVQFTGLVRVTVRRDSL